MSNKINVNRIFEKALTGKSTKDKLLQRAAGWCEAALPQRKITLEFSAEARMRFKLERLPSVTGASIRLYARCFERLF